MAAESNITITVKAKTTQAVSALKGLGAAAQTNAEQLKKVGQGMSSVGMAMTAAITLPIVAAGAALISMGANLEEAQNLVRESFGDMAMAAEEWANALSDSLGLNRYELQESAAMLNVMMVSMGLAKEEAFGMSTSLIELAHDMASFYNLPFEEALLKLQAGLTGEAEPLKRLGILVNDTTIKTWAWTNGLVAQGEKLTEQQKVLARYGAIMESTKNAQGDLERTSSSFTNTMRRMSSQIQESAARLGQELIPIIMSFFVPAMEKAIQVVMFLSTAFSQSHPYVKLTVLAVLGLVAAVGPLLTVGGLLLTALPSMAAGIALVGTAFTTTSVATVGATGTLATYGTVAGTTTVAVQGLGVAIGVVLLKALAAVAVAIAAYKITEWAMEWSGLRKWVDAAYEAVWKFLSVSIDTEPQIKMMADASKIAGREVTDFAEALKITNGHIAKLRGETAPAAEAVESFADRMERLWGVTESATQSLVEEMAATKQAAKEAKIMTEAKKLLGRAATDLAEAERTLAINVSMLNAAFDQLTPALEAHGRVVFENVKQLEMAQVATQDMIRGDDDWMNTLGELDDHLEDNTGLIVEAGKEAVKAVERTATLAKETANLTDVMGAGTRVMGDIGNALSIFGINIDSVIGKATRLISTFESLFGSLSGIMKMLSGGGATSMGGGLLGGLGGLFGGGGDGGGGLPSIGSFMPDMTGMGSTAGTGFLSSFTSTMSSGFSSLGATLAPLFTNPFTIGVAAIIGGWFALKAIFGGPSTFESVGEEAARDFGMSFSEGLQHHIVNLAEDVFGGDRAAAMQSALSLIIREGLADGFDSSELDMYTEKIADTFSFIERGQLSATEGQQILNDAVAQLIPHLDELGVEGVAELERILAASDRLGIEFDGQGDLVQALLNHYGELGQKVPPWIQDIAGELGVVTDAAGDTIDVTAEVGAAFADLSGEGRLAFEEISGSIDDRLIGALTGAQGETRNLATDLGNLPRNIDINITKHISEVGGGGGGGGSDRSAQGGFFSPSLPSDLLIQTHRGERVEITPAGHAQAGQSPTIIQNVIHNYTVLDGQVIDKKIVRTVNKAGRLGDINYLGDVQADPRG